MEKLELLETLNKKLEFSNQLNYQILMSNIIIHSDIDKKDKELLLLLLQDRDRNYIRINHNKECYKNIMEYLRLLRPIDIPLENLKRVGGNRDGGYVIC